MEILFISTDAPEESFFKEKAVVGQSFTIECEVNGRPEPSYTIVHNNTEVIGTDKTYTIADVNKTHAGLYKCIAENRLGKSSKIYLLSVVGKIQFFWNKRRHSDILKINYFSLTIKFYFKKFDSDLIFTYVFLF